MSLLPEGFEDAALSYGLQGAIIGLVVAGTSFGVVFLLSIPFFGAVSALGVVLTIVSTAARFYAGWRRDNRIDDNEQFGEVAKAVEQERQRRAERDAAQQKLMEYHRITRLLKDRGVDLATLIDNQTEASQIGLLVFRDQDAPEDHEYFEVEDENDENKFIRYRTQEGFDGDTISSFTWMIPPSVIAEEGLQGADREDFKTWFKENIYDYYDDDEFQANVLLAGLMDVDSIFSITKEETRLGKFAENLIEYDDEFTEEDFYNALSDERVNMLQEVKDGRLVFFLPDTLDEDTVDRIRESEDVVKSGLQDGGLRELADEDSTEPLTEGFEELGIPKPEEIAQDVVEEAKLWERKIEEANSGLNLQSEQPDEEPEASDVNPEQDESVVA